MRILIFLLSVTALATNWECRKVNGDLLNLGINSPDLSFNATNPSIEGTGSLDTVLSTRTNFVFDSLEDLEGNTIDPALAETITARHVGTRITAAFLKSSSSSVRYGMCKVVN